MKKINIEVKVGYIVEFKNKYKDILKGRVEEIKEKTVNIRIDFYEAQGIAIENYLIEVYKTQVIKVISKNPTKVKIIKESNLPKFNVENVTVINL